MGLGTASQRVESLKRVVQIRRFLVFAPKRASPNLLANPALVRNALLAVLPDLFPKDSLPETRENLRSRPARSLDLVAS